MNDVLVQIFWREDMNKLAFTLLLFLFPGLALADGFLNFSPPASDYSVVFLGNLFGVVDGVLSGTGSQIMGNMFGVFNAAVLAIGGIIILYTLIVATMNTAHEGQMLGQKWSSVWIPIRSTVGLALLIPKSSGYCLMQIVVMWVVVQGVGAADQVWNSALSYLNRGGVIIQAQQSSPTAQLTANPSSGIGGIATGADTILAGQVCMLGLQTQLENTRQAYLDEQAKKTGPCNSASPGSPMATFCSTVVPDFLSSVNTISVQNADPIPQSKSWSVDMPNFDSSSPYYYLNGICGTVTWNSITQNSAFQSLPPDPTSPVTVGNTNLTPSEVSTIEMSRAIAIQQMYTDLSSVARAMINNDPQMSPTTNNDNNNLSYSPVAEEQFGVPYTQTGTTCQTSNQCVAWGPITGISVGNIFTGLELINSINDYNGVMMPTINLARMITSNSNEQAATNFISKASTQGWIMAGAYYYNLVQIQGASSITNSTQIDSNTGLESSKFDPTAITSPFANGGSNITCNHGDMTGQGKDFSNLCYWFNQNDTAVKNVQALITTTSPSSSMPTLSANMKLISGSASSTVYGFVNNSLMMQTPGQPGTQPITFAGTPDFTVDPTPYYLYPKSFSCGSVKPYYTICLGSIIGDVVYNVIIVPVYDSFVLLFGKIIGGVIGAFLKTPLQGMAEIFQQGLAVLTQPGVNPVVALANMGNAYINFAGNLWMYLLGLAVTSSLIPIFGVFIFALLTLGMPLIIAWVGIMVSIGFTTAYYIPILPYVIFTFGALGWMMAVIEAMVAGPIVALGITHPEGHDAFGKGDAAIMLLLNIFLRPSMMIIGYIAAIALSYVGVWLLNTGYDQAITFVQQEQSTVDLVAQNTVWVSSGGGGSLSDWTAIYAFFFSILNYTVLYLTIIQKSFTLITYLPDKVLRWIGGPEESIGQESTRWADEVKSKNDEAGKETNQAQGAMQKSMGGMGIKAVGKAKGALGKAFGGSGNVSAEGDEPQVGNATSSAPPVTK